MHRVTRQALTLSSLFLAIVSAAAGCMGLALIGHSFVTPSSQLPSLDRGPSHVLLSGLAAVSGALLLGLLSYLLRRILARERA